MAHGLSIDTNLVDSEWPWTTLKGIVSFLRSFLPNLIASLANYVIVVKGRPMMFAKYCLPVPAFHAARSFLPVLNLVVIPGLRAGYCCAFLRGSLTVSKCVCHLRNKELLFFCEGEDYGAYHIHKPNPLCSEVSAIAKLLVPCVITHIDWTDVCREIGWRSKFKRRSSWSELQRCMGHGVWWLFQRQRSNSCLPFSWLHVRFLYTISEKNVAKMSFATSFMKLGWFL